MSDYDLSTYDGRARAYRRIKAGLLPDDLRDALLDLLARGEFPKRRGAPPKPVHLQLRDYLRGVARRGAGSSALDAGERDRIYRPNRKRRKERE